MNKPEDEVNFKLTNLEVEMFYNKWASRLDSDYVVEFGEDLMVVLKALGDSIIGMMRSGLNDV